ncbi:MAG: stage II sporulation protein P [Oscillospiraceae bacterium]|nr:stage II sporulation protein P [Oscillospiraceae bacterium]
MDQQRKTVRLGAGLIVLAITLRLVGGGFFEPVGKLFQSEGAQSFLVYLMTGRLVRRPQSVPQQTQPLQTQPPEQSLPPEAVLTFSPEDMQSISVYYGCDYRPDVESLLTQPLGWDLTGDAPSVLIVHTHGTEAYTQTPGTEYEEDAAYRTLDEHYNMVSIGEEVARVLEAGGISVLHDRSYHDYPSYNGAYGNSRIAIEEYLRQYPSIQMVLDIHRDASDGANGTQLTTSATVDGQPSSQLLVVVGTDAGGNYHPNWQQNFALALKLSAVLERSDPGVTRPVSLRSSRFNMDLTPGSLLIEVGAAGDTHEQAMLAANALARGILALAKGSK